MTPTALLLPLLFCIIGQAQSNDADEQLIVGTTAMVSPMVHEEEQQQQEQLTRKLVKRAPSGFMGMRGRRDWQNAASASAAVDDSGAVDALNPMAQEYNAADLYEQADRFKKTPTSFFGLGTKNTPTDLTRLGQLIQRLEEENLRENVLQDFLHRLASSNTPMNSIEYIGKRVPTGFSGMRGKRPEQDTDEGAANDMLHDEAMLKRAPVNSFVGMRGKKDVSEHQNYKRAAPQNFIYNFFHKAFETRGKKQRYLDFGNKFVAVRGKKNYDVTSSAAAAPAATADNDNFGYENDDVQYINYPESSIWQHKRAPNGFMGMRGKRPEYNMALLQ